ncbi:MAG: hypothetical protein K6G48_07295 [Acholeplasmatales bacterium]|nr:hypothetical protein [Acholeplasmatales bacterium]
MKDKNVIDAEVVDNEAKEEKTEGPKKDGFFSKIKKKYNDVQLENKISDAFKEKAEQYVIYRGTSILNGNQFYAKNYEADGYIIAWLSDKPVITDALISARRNEDVFKMSSCEKVDVVVNLEGTDYTRSAYKITLGEKALKANVVKVEDNFFLL